MIQLLRAAIPGVWIGLIGALSFLETPLKFLAPGMTLEVALGVGRLVLTAANIAGFVLLALITVLSFLRPRIRKPAWVAVIGLWVVLIVQVAVIRPPLNARTDIIVAGGDPGESSLHVVYIVADVILLILLVVYLFAARQKERRDAVAA